MRTVYDCDDYDWLHRICGKVGEEITDVERNGEDKMREILFRGFHEYEDGDKTIFVDGRKVRGRWAFGYPLIYNANCSSKKNGQCDCSHDVSYSCIFEWRDDLHEYDDVEVILSTIGQSTGLTAKNGVKIFEGDIFQTYWPDCKAVAEWDEDCGRFLGYTIARERRITYIGRDPQPVEVIGTIFDAPQDVTR